MRRGNNFSGELIMYYKISTLGFTTLIETSTLDFTTLMLNVLTKMPQFPIHFY